MQTPYPHPTTPIILLIMDWQQCPGSAFQMEPLYGKKLALALFKPPPFLHSQTHPPTDGAHTHRHMHTQTYSPAYSSAPIYNKSGYSILVRLRNRGQLATMHETGYTLSLTSPPNAFSALHLLAREKLLHAASFPPPPPSSRLFLALPLMRRRPRCHSGDSH